MAKYLDSVGVQYLWQQIEAELATRDGDISDINALIGTVASGHTVEGDISAVSDSLSNLINTALDGKGGSGKYITGFSTANGGLQSANLVTSITDSTSTAHPATAAAIASYVSGKTSGAEVEEDNTKLVTGGQVYDAIEDAISGFVTSSAITNAINALDVSTDPTGDYVTKVLETDGKIAVTKASKGSVAASGDASLRLVDGQTVNTAITNAINALDVSAPASGDYVATISETNGKISATMGTKGTITDGSTGLVDGNAVYDAIEDTKEELTGEFWADQGGIPSLINLNYLGHHGQDAVPLTLASLSDDIDFAMETIATEGMHTSTRGQNIAIPNTYDGQSWINSPELGDPDGAYLVKFTTKTEQDGTTYPYKEYAKFLTTVPAADATTGDGAKKDKTAPTALAVRNAITAAVQALDGSQTATGDYVTSVTQTDGIVTATRASKGSVAANNTGLVDGGTVKTAIDNAINALDKSDTAVAGKYISTVSETDGKITVTRADLATTITENSTTAPTAGAVYTAIQTAVAGLSGAMHYKGTSSTAITDGGTQNPTIGGSTVTTKAAGDVVLYNNQEFVWTGTAWELLGDEGTYAIKTRKISAGSGLSGGGDLTADRTISHATPTGASSGDHNITADASGKLYVQSGVTTDSFGHTTAVKSKDIYSDVETIAQAKVTAAASNYATAAQGALADSALQSHQTVTLASGTNNGTLKITTAAGTTDNIAVKGLGSAAYTASTAYDASGAASTAKSQVIGASTDAKTANTIYGAKAFATDAVSTLEGTVVKQIKLNSSASALSPTSGVVTLGIEALSNTEILAAINAAKAAV